MSSEPGLADFEDQVADDEVRRLVRQRDAMKRERDAVLKANEKMEAQLDLLTGIDSVVTDRPPAWMTPKTRRTKADHGIANLLLSDLHLDEVVKPAEVSGYNAYNRAIAYDRLRRTFDQFIEVARNYLNGVTYDGAHIWLNGDIFSGNIHEELKETNEAPIMASFDYWIDPMVAGLKMVADEFGKLQISVRVGNHGRRSRKPVAKSRVEDNFDWLYGRVLHREMKADTRITWDIPKSPDGLWTQYNTTFLATHGDQFRGGSGIAGILSPLSLGDHRKSRRQSAIGEPYDIMLIGHFHQLLWLPRIICNGSLKGLDEYAFQANFGFEVPQQAMWTTTPQRGVTFQCAIQPMNRARERW